MNNSVTLRPQYTESEISSRSSELPGLVEPGDVFTILTDPRIKCLWQPVLSATVVTRFNGQLQVLTGKRTAEGNTTHTNVASTPTMRIPDEEAGLLLPDHVPFCLSGSIDPLKPFISESLTPSVAGLPDSRDVLAAKVANLLALKLGLGQALESSRQGVGRASLARCIVGFSYLDDTVTGEALFEPLIMLGAVVGLDQKIAEQIPPATVSYSNLGWTPLSTYVHGVATKTLFEVIPSAKPEDELEVCVRGLCNATSSAILSTTSEIQYHLTEEGILPEF